MEVRRLVAIYISVLIATTAYGISFPLLAINLEQMGISGTLIGVNAAMPALGWLIGAFWLPRLLGHFGLRWLLTASLLIACVSLVGFSLSSEFWVWTALRFLFGGSLGMFYRAIEFWINYVSEDRVRGRNIGIYGVCFMLGIAVGSSLQPSLGASGALPYATILALLVATTAVVLSTSDRSGISNASVVRVGLSSAIILAVPVALLGTFAYGMYEDIPAYLMSVYALRNGLDAGTAAFTLTAFAIGNLIFPIPIGILSDRVNRTVLLMVCALAAAIGLSMIPATLSNPTTLLSLLVVCGGLTGAVYSTSLAIIGDRFEGDELVLANANFGIVYAIGALVGPLINGAALDRMDSHGLIVAAVLILLSLAACAAAFLIRSARRTPA